MSRVTWLVADKDLMAIDATARAIQPLDPFRFSIFDVPIMAFPVVCLSAHPIPASIRSN